jgi:hypothetical protein
MLTKEQKELIRQEEIFRNEIRQELDLKKKPRTWRQKLSAFFNTGFGLWLLSRILVGRLTFGYSWLQNRWAQEKQKDEQFDRVNMEIIIRISDFKASLDHVTDSKSLHEALRNLDDPSQPKYGKGVFPDFKERTFKSLL